MTAFKLFIMCEYKRKAPSSHEWEERVSIKIRAYANRREQGVILTLTFPYNFFSIEQLVHKLLRKNYQIFS